MRELRIVYMGTPDFAVYPLQKLLEAGHHVVAVVTNPDKPAGRGQKIQESPVKKFAVEKGIPVLQPERFRDERFLADLRAFRADLQLVVAFKMLPEVVWNMPPLGTVNLHASLLPDYRGAAPINWAVINGETCSGVTTFLLKHEIDTGNLIFQERVEIGETMTAGELHDQLMYTGADLLVKTVEAMASGEYPLQDQTGLLAGREPKHAPKIFKEDMKVDWTLGLDMIYNRIRGLSPFPTAWTELKNKKTGETVSLKIFVTERIPKEYTGDVTLATDNKTFLDVLVKGGAIRIKELQLSGKKRMKTDEFLRGFHVEDYTL
ncbi:MULTISPECIES: methionyl-tRNA formyltransferase [Odoribacteraceae]|uniref:methionyl-tRNA formyltransferase n=1 Tax=Odoribacteraceae TaxID=1853231 RepID=UPI000E495204|nr:MULTISPECIES: methionyl-tRNA formyltransferase [Odoribacteraceae]MCQ4873408.1 methionyl-tRNA formyltransferase [Butyricimonas paravirosa]RHR79130.1 methionyl-tRNA formyltransferase [Odoribacter sp. AF15-53]